MPATDIDPEIIPLPPLDSRLDESDWPDYTAEDDAEHKAAEAAQARIKQIAAERAREMAPRLELLKAFRNRDTATIARLSGIALPSRSPATGTCYPGIVSSADFVKGFVPPDYHLDGIAQAGFLYALTAGTGTGKTAVLLALTASTALGTTLCGRDVRKGRVVYFAGENPDDVRMRWLAMAHHLGFDPAAMDVHFIAGTFSIPAATARISMDVERLGGADAIVVDTSAAYFQGEDENGNTALGKHARDLRALTDLPGKPAVFVACHPTKNADPANLQPRGGGAFIAEVDGNLVLTKDGGLAKLHWQVKHRGPDFKPLFFALETVTAPGLVDSKGNLVPTVMATGMADWVPAPAATTKAEPWQSALDILQERGPLSEHEWCAAYIEFEPEGNADSIARKWRRHRVKLVDMGKVVLDGDLYSLPDTGHGHSGHVRGDVRDKNEGAQNLPTDIADTGHGHSPSRECPGVRMSGDAGEEEKLDGAADADLTDSDVPAFLHREPRP